MKKKREVVSPPLVPCAASECPNSFVRTRSDREYCSHRCGARVRAKRSYVPTGRPVGRPRKVDA